MVVKEGRVHLPIAYQSTDYRQSRGVRGVRQEVARETPRETDQFRKGFWIFISRTSQLP